MGNNKTKCVCQLNLLNAFFCGLIQRFWGLLIFVLAYQARGFLIFVEFV